jgi:hypothetical protein
MSFGVAMREIRSGLGSDPLADHIFAGDEIDALIPPFVLAADQLLDGGNFFFVHAWLPPNMFISFQLIYAISQNKGFSKCILYLVFSVWQVVGRAVCLSKITKHKIPNTKH